MDPSSRYRNPRAPQPTRTGITSGMDKVSLGQKLIIYAILVNVITIVAALVASRPRLAIAVGLIALALSLAGVVLISKGMGSSVGRTVLLVVLMLVPLVNIGILLMLNHQATTALRLAGYQVGLFGASK